ncbi:MAG: hypothetical protein GC160_10470 [Acidobacteria bacterium]|nr:hypothetical protein [Acidobacteriota bacterium]
MTCSSCGSDNPGESLFCIRCGAPMPGAQIGAGAAPSRPASLVDPYHSGSSAGVTPAASWSAQPARGMSAVVYGGFWVRFLAVLIDGILLFIAQTIVVFPIGFVIGAVSSNSSAAQAVASGIGFLVGMLGNWLYEAILISSDKQATLGKMAMGLKVTNIHGGRLSFAHATGRHFAKWVSAFTLLIGYLIQPFTQRKQALHDLIAGTLVVKKA